MNIGIDAGGTLIKIAYMKDGTPHFKKHPIAELDVVAAWIITCTDAKICITGGQARQLRAKLNQEVAEIVEFEATCIGVRYFLGEDALNNEAFILTNVGTGTSIHYVDRSEQLRLGGTGVGGGTIMGLSQALTGFTDFDSIAAAASKGDRDRIDLKVSHIYEGSVPPIPGDLTASNFGRISSMTDIGKLSKEELLAAIVGLVGETVATTSVLAAGQKGKTTIIYIGSSFIGNNLLKDVVQRYTILRGAIPLFIDNGEYSGAMGALSQIG